MVMTSKTNASKPIVLLGLLLLNAWSGKAPGKSFGKAIAKDNGEEISVHQFLFVPSRAIGINP